MNLDRFILDFNPDNPILKTDTYKFGHMKLIPKTVLIAIGYLEARGVSSQMQHLLPDYTVVLGLKSYINNVLNKPFTHEDIVEAEAFARLHGADFNAKAFSHILNKHGGYWPVEIRSVPEGTIVPTGNALAQWFNTDPNSPWVTLFLDTYMLRYIWTNSTVATICCALKDQLRDFALESSDSYTLDESYLETKLIDFGSRGSSNPDVGIGQLLSFNISDNLSAIGSVLSNYQDHDLPAKNIFGAGEHSTVTMWGQENEHDAYLKVIETFCKDGKWGAAPVDSYDVDNALRNIIGGTLRSKIINCGGTFVARLDSGEPSKTVVEALYILGDRFGFSVNSLGYRVLPDYIRVFQADKVDVSTLRGILDSMRAAKWSLDNIAFGSGGGLLQHMDRDWYGWAAKCNATIDTEMTVSDVRKKPVGSPDKWSKPGPLKLVSSGSGCYDTIQTTDLLEEYDDCLVQSYANGTDYLEPSFEEVRRYHARQVIPK